NRYFLDRLADSVNAVSQFSADSLAHVDGFWRGRIEVIENGIDLAKFTLNSRPPPELDPARRYIVNVARLHPVKDHATLLRAFQKLAAVHPEVDLVLVGDGELHPDLAKLSQKLGIQDRVRFLGVRDDVPAILHVCTVFVLTSLSEGAPLT